VELDTPINNESLVNVERDLYQVDESITYVKGINSTLVLIQAEEGTLEFPSEFFPSRVDLIFDDTFRNGSEYIFDFIDPPQILLDKNKLHVSFI